MNPEIAILERPIGPGHPVYIVAELSANHSGELESARNLVRAAADAGADAVKLQTYTPDTITLNCSEAHFQIKEGPWAGRTLYELYQEAFTPWAWYPELSALASELGMHCFSSPFDPTAVDFLEAQGAPAYKIASFEITDIPLLKKVGRTQKPVILSTGMAHLAEIEEAVAAVGSSPLALLRTNSGYPARPEEMELLGLRRLADQFRVVVGLSDHTLGTVAPVVAVALGAAIVEKHLTLDRGAGGPDAAFSLEPEEFREMVMAVRLATAALGTGRFGPTAREQTSLPFRRSLFVVEEIEAGEPFTEKNVRSIRPGGGLHPRHLDLVLSKRSAQKLKKGTPLNWEMLTEEEGLLLRDVEVKDEELIFEWANDTLTRSMSFSSTQISWGDHQSWFQKRLMDPASLFYIAENQGRPVGQVRFEQEGDEVLVSLTVAPEERGKGYASRIISSGVVRAGLSEVVAYIKPENARSVRAFERAGYGLPLPVSFRGHPALRMTWRR